MAKKKKSEAGKRRNKSRQKMKKKRSLRSMKSRQERRTEATYRPGLPYMGAPEGFRSISMSQAMIEYGKPLMKYFEDDESAFDVAIQISMMLWNYSISVEKGYEHKEMAHEILKALREALDLNKDEAKSLLTKMMERRTYLFPPEIQPGPGTLMFIRKEVRYLIQPFDYEKLVISDEAIPADQDDTELIEKMKALDSLIRDGEDYSTYEKLLLTLIDDSESLFERWLVARGMSDDAREYSFCLQTYLEFIYGYMHDDVVVLKSVPDIYFIEFFEDFLLRKMMVEPNEYVYWPPAVKLFYRFLYEKGYLKNHEEIIRQIDKVEPYFIQVLKRQFS
jgi:hypothetical protein